MSNLNPNQFGPREGPSIEISEEARQEMLAAASAGKMRAEVAQGAQRTPVRLNDPTDLQAHLISAHEWDDNDFHRNSNWHGESLDPVLGRNQSGDDYRMGHSEISRVHEHEHRAYKDDWPNAVTMDTEHFHE
jgi:hypothetical protein